MNFYIDPLIFILHGDTPEGKFAGFAPARADNWGFDVWRFLEPQI